MTNRVPTLRNYRVCHYCGVVLTEKNTSVDHVMPRSKGGEDDFSNLVFACKKCNSLKGSGDYETFKAWKLPEKQARLSGRKIPDIGVAPGQIETVLINKTKMPLSDFETLRALSDKKAFLAPAGGLPSRRHCRLYLFHGLTLASNETVLRLKKQKWIEESKTPKGLPFVFVWRLSAAGREYLNAIDNDKPD